MTFRWTVCGLLASWLAAVSPAGAEPRDNQEPPELYYFEADGKRVPVELGKPFDTARLAGVKTAVLRVEPHRVFRFAGVQFHYPRGYTFEFDAEVKDLNIWTMSGPDCILTIQQHKESPDPDTVVRDLLKELSAIYKDAKKSQRPVSLKVKDTTLSGRRLEVVLADSLIVQDVYSFRSGKDVVVLLIQDSPGEDGKPSADRVRAEKMLIETLVLPAK